MDITEHWHSLDYITRHYQAFAGIRGYSTIGITLHFRCYRSGIELLTGVSRFVWLYDTGDRLS